MKNIPEEAQKSYEKKEHDEPAYEQESHQKSKS